MELALTSRSVEEFEIIEVGGEVDVYTAPKLREAIVTAIDAGHTKLLSHAHHERVNSSRGHRIESCGGFVVQDVLGAQRDGAGNADPFAHTAREFGWHAELDVGQVDERQRLVHASGDFRFAEFALLAQSHGDVLTDGHGVEKRRELKHVADPSA